MRSRKNKFNFGVHDASLANPAIQKLIAESLKNNYVPDKYISIIPHLRLNTTLRDSLALNDLQQMEMYITVNRNHSYPTLFRKLGIPLRETNWTKYEFTMWATYLIYEYYWNRKRNNGIFGGIRGTVGVNGDYIHDQFGVALWELPGPLNPGPVLLRKYIKMLSKPNLTIQEVFNYVYNNFSVDQIELTNY